MLDSYYKGEAFHDQTQTSGNISAGGSFGKKFNIGGSLSGGVSAINSDNTGSTKQFNSSEDIAIADKVPRLMGGGVVVSRIIDREFTDKIDQLNKNLEKK